MFDHAHPLGLLAWSKARDAQELIGRTEQLVASLGPTAADLTPAEEALQAAKALFDAEAFSKAAVQARRAATLAVSLNERFTQYVAAWKVLQACREELEQLSFPTEVLEAALAAADHEVVRLVEEDGAVVPNYLGATELLERATCDARTVVTRAREASREILLATLAIEALSDSPSTPIPSWLAVRLEGMAEQATHELALGHASEASRIASEARVRADDALAGAARSWELLDLAAAVLDGLGAEGRAADALVGKIDSAREALGRGFLDRGTASEVARRLSDEAASFARHYPRARKALEHAERVYGRLQRDGFCSYNVDVALSEARHALGAGDWAGVKAKVGSASAAFVRLRKEQRSLARAISDIDERVGLLKDLRLPLLPYVEEILGRAREEVRGGRLSGASEDLLLASVLMRQATRTGS